MIKYFVSFMGRNKLTAVGFVIRVTLSIKKLPPGVSLRPRLLGIPRRHCLEKPPKELQARGADVGADPQILQELSGEGIRGSPMVLLPFGVCGVPGLV